MQGVPSVAVRSTAMRLRVIFRLSANREASAYVTCALSLYEGLKSDPPCLVFCLNCAHTSVGDHAVQRCQLVTAR